MAVILVQGKGARAVVQTFFQPRFGKTLAEAPTHRVLYGSIQGEDGLACPTESGVEIHCHGSQAATARICRLLEEQGCRPGPQKLPPVDPIRQRALELLPWAVTQKTARILLDQYHGAYPKDIACGKNPERWRHVAEHLVEPWRIVLAGRPNVGKSALFNAILGFSRAIVYEQAGTTRDLLRERTTLEGWPIELIDTAGLHDSEQPIEQEGIRRAMSEIQRADLILHLRTPDEEKGPDVLDFHGIPVLEIWNKADLFQELAQEKKIAISAQTGMGVEALLKKIIRQLIPEEPPPGTGMPI